MIGRYISHALAKHFKMVRYYSFMSNRKRGELLPKVYEALQMEMRKKTGASGLRQLAAHTVGGVVTAAQPLMVIEPADAPVEVEAFVENQDIGFIHPVQGVAVKIETFNYTRYVIHHGDGEQRVPGCDRGADLQRTDSAEPEDDGYRGGPVGVSPGMAVRAEIKTDRQRVINYFLSPLKVYIDESLHER